jgi:Icc-related predicted phosphoesterase
MRVLIISDKVVDLLHGAALAQHARGVELVLSCGDLPADYLEFIVSVLNVPLFYVMGNHGSDGGEKAFPDGCENLDGRVLEHKGLLIAGLEGSMRYNNRPNYQYTENEMRGKIALLTPALLLNRARYGRYLDVLVAHAPPYKIHDDTDLPHTGFKSFVWLIDHYQPRYFLHGHKHVYNTREQTVTERGATSVINTYGYRILEIEPARAKDKVTA